MKGNPMLCVRVPWRQLHDIAEVARAEGLTRQEVMRRAVRKGLAEVRGDR